MSQKDLVLLQMEMYDTILANMKLYIFYVAHIGNLLLSVLLLAFTRVHSSQLYELSVALSGRSVGRSRQCLLSTCIEKCIVSKIFKRYIHNKRNSNYGAFRSECLITELNLLWYVVSIQLFEHLLLQTCFVVFALASIKAYLEGKLIIIRIFGACVMSPKVILPLS